MADYLVFNDSTGEFCTSDEILAVLDAKDGSEILTKVNGGACLYSPLKPRELLRRLTIMRFKRENDGNTQNRRETGTRQPGTE